jgi:hypothetical protein
VIRVRVISNEIGDDGQLIDRLAAAFEVRGQDLAVTEGDAQFVPIGMPVFSERYGGLIDFDVDGEEWARSLPSAYRNGAIAVTVEDTAEPSVSASDVQHAYAGAHAHRAR